MTADLRGTAQLVRLVLRRDRVRLPVWIVALTALTYFSGNAMGTTFPTQASIDSYADSMAGSPAAIALSGPPIGLDTLAGIVLNKVYLIGVVGVALMAIFEVVRHTRAEEEDGRTELLRSAAVGRDAGAAAATLVASVASLLVGLGVGLAAQAAGVPFADAILYGASVAALGVLFAGATLFLAQLFTHARGTSGAALALLRGGVRRPRGRRRTGERAGVALPGGLGAGDPPARRGPVVAPAAPTRRSGRPVRSRRAAQRPPGRRSRTGRGQGRQRPCVAMADRSDGTGSAAAAGQPGRLGGRDVPARRGLRFAHPGGGGDGQGQRDPRQVLRGCRPGDDRGLVPLDDAARPRSAGRWVRRLVRAADHVRGGSGAARAVAGHADDPHPADCSQRSA